MFNDNFFNNRKLNRSGVLTPPPDPGGNTIPDVLFNAPLTADLEATGYGTITKTTANVAASAKGVQVLSAEINPLWQTQVRPGEAGGAWYKITSPTITLDYDTTPYGIPASLIQNTGAGAAQGTVIYDVLNLTGNSTYVEIRVVAKNYEAAPTGKFRVYLFGTAGTQASYDIAFDNTVDPLRPGTITWNASLGTEGASSYVYKGNGFYEYTLRLTTSAVTDSLKLQIHADRDNLSKGLIVAECGMAIFTTTKTPLVRTNRTTTGLTIRQAGSLKYSGVDLQPNNMSGILTVEAPVIPEGSTEAPLMWVGNNTNWKSAATSGFGVFLSRNAIVFRKVVNGAVVTNGGCYYNIISGDNENGKLLEGSKFKIGWRMHSTNGMELYINGVKLASKTNTDDVTLGPIYIGSDGSTQSNCFVKDVTIFYEGNP